MGRPISLAATTTTATINEAQREIQRYMCLGVQMSLRGTMHFSVLPLCLHHPRVCPGPFVPGFCPWTLPAGLILEILKACTRAVPPHHLRSSCCCLTKDRMPSYKPTGKPALARVDKTPPTSFDRQQHWQTGPKTPDHLQTSSQRPRNQ